MPNYFKSLPKCRNFAKSGHTGYQPLHDLAFPRYMICQHMNLSYIRSGCLRVLTEVPDAVPVHVAILVTGLPIVIIVIFFGIFGIVEPAVIVVPVSGVWPTGPSLSLGVVGTRKKYNLIRLSLTDYNLESSTLPSACHRMTWTWSYKECLQRNSTLLLSRLISC